MKDMSGNFEHESLDSITPAMVELIQQGIDLINTKKFEILSILKFKNNNSFV